MKKFIILILSLILLGCNNQVGSSTDNSKMVWSIDDSQQISLRAGNASGGASPSSQTILNPGDVWQSVSTGTDDWLVLDIFASPKAQNYINTTTVHIKTGAPVGTDSSGNPDGFLTFTYVKDTLGMPWYTIKSTQVVTTPPIISNDWTNGLDNNNKTLEVPDSYWVQDYGFDDVGRWKTDGTAVYQSTAASTIAQQPTFGSRGYPVHILNDKYEVDSTAHGTAFDGVWQIDIKIGSNGLSTNLYCETFYIAERANLVWGASNYSDGSDAGGPAGYSREIDIIETKWNGGSTTEIGPQFNLPNGDNTGWNTDNEITTAKGLMKAQWSQFYGAPASDFATFGVAILDNGLYFYGYKGDTQIYSYGPVVEKNSNYTQKSPFVPYIGTWTDSTTTTPGGFSTGYKNFIYKSKDNITGNPVDNPNNFPIKN